MKKAAIVMPDYPNFTHEGVQGKVEKKIFSTLKDVEEYVDSLNQQWFTHWLVPTWTTIYGDEVNLLQIFEMPSIDWFENDFVLYIGCITI